MMLSNRMNRLRYRLYAPLYAVLARPLEAGRRRAFERLALEPEDRILIVGAGPGVDLPYMPDGASVTAVDISEAMVNRTATRGAHYDLDLDSRIADAHDLPFPSNSFDVVILHLILSVVPEPGRVAAEAERVLASDGRISIYDKFAPDDRRPSVIRRVLNPVTRALFSDITRQLKPILTDTDLSLEERESVLAGIYTIVIARSDEANE